MKKCLIIALAASILLAGCSKDKQSGNQPSSSVKISIVSGDGQTDTVGQPVKDVEFKVTKNGAPAAGYTVTYQLSGCNSDRTDKSTSGADGTVKEYWVLAGDVGQQSMTAIVLDANNKHIDSVTAHATAIATGKGWHPAACTTGSVAQIASFCKLSTGRLISCHQGQNYLRYSDDNGLSWNALKSLANTHNFEYAISTGSDGIFAFAYNEAPFYSPDAGQTWKILPATPFSKEQITSVSYTASGKILLITRDSGLYISVDNGKTWTLVSASLSNTNGLTCAAEAQNGDLYVIDDDLSKLFRSVDEGQHWTDTTPPTKPNLSDEQDLWFYIDPATNYFYKTRFDPAGGIYVSKDNGETYTMLISIGQWFITDLTIQTDGNMYYYFSGQGMYKASAAGANPQLLWPVSSFFSFPYILAQNNNFAMVIDDGFTIWVYRP
ncbi:MAG TPA: sialidase family protein [Mucilaginibacter sp.]|jgi:photosystem II stability/assembly factor-like uncharacterized protein|nr:sialidase family protein [Mucilaginibacter sp.]